MIYTRLLRASVFLIVFMVEIYLKSNNQFLMRYNFIYVKRLIINELIVKYEYIKYLFPESV